MKSHPASKSTATGPHYTGHNGEVFTHECPTPPRPLKSGANRHGFPNRESMVPTALERFLSVEKFGIAPSSRSSQASSLMLSPEVGNYFISSRLAYLELRGH